MMNAQELAAQLDGGVYGLEISKDLEAQAKAAGLVVVFGGSDDLAELRGAIHDEVGCYGGGKFRIDAAGILPDYESAEHDDEESMREWFRRDAGAVAIEAHWGKDGYSWTYSTAIPHTTFEITDEGDKYCRGIVFSMADVATAAKSG
jgi:hypothetical protein